MHHAALRPAAHNEHALPHMDCICHVLHRFQEAKTTADYESVIRSSTNGVPERWIPEVAEQCVDSSPSPQCRRYAFHLAPHHVSSAVLALAVKVCM